MDLGDPNNTAVGNVSPMVVNLLSRRPHRCPVCGGRGTVAADFYARIGSAIGVNNERCQSCTGSGVIWG